MRTKTKLTVLPGDGIGPEVITQAMRIFCQDIESPAERRRAVMKVYITLYGGISLYTAGVLDQPSEKALIAELSAMNAGM